jgi:lysophospholipase L1-like esterase
VFHALATLLSVAISLVLAEGFLRLKNASMTNYDVEMWRYSRTLKSPSPNPILGHTHRPSLSATLQSVEIRLNARGLRGEEVSPLAPSGRRILVLGSSITLGWGVAEEETLTARLQAKFREAGQANVQVLNAGIGNYNAARYVERFLTELEDLRPTDVVVHYFVNDAEQLTAGGGNALTRNSQLAVAVWSALQKRFHAGGEGGLEAHYREVYRHDAPGYLAMREALGRLATYAKANGVRLVLAMTPDIHDLRDYRFGFVHDEVKEIAEGLGYRYVDLLPALAGLDPAAIWNMPGDPHPNGAGHERMAETLYPLLATPARSDGK